MISSEALTPSAKDSEPADLLGTVALTKHRRRFWRGIALTVAVMAVIALALAAYSESVLSRTVKHDRFVTSARGYLKRGLIAAAIVQYNNAIRADASSAETHYELGLALLRVGDGRAAVSQFYRAADLEPDMIKARFQIGQLYVYVNDLPRAKEQLAKMQNQDLRAIETRTLAVEVNLAEGNLDAGLEEIRAAIKENPAIDEFYLILGNIYSRKGDIKGAESAYRKILDREPKAHKARAALVDLYLNFGQSDKVEGELLAGIAADPDREEPIHRLANYYSVTNQLGRFEQLLLDLLRKKPDSLGAKKRLAELALVRGDLPQAKLRAQEITRLEPDGADGHFLRGRIYLAEKNFVKASEELDIVASGAQQSADAAYYYGLVRMALNYPQQARVAFLKATFLRPHWREAHLELARVYLALGNNTLAAQESDLVLKVEPENRGALNVAANALLKRGESEKALILFLRLKKLDGHDAATLVSIGNILRTQKQFDAALSEYEAALKSDPQRLDALSGLAHVYIQQGKVALAFERASQHLVFSKDPARVHQLLAQLRLETKEYDQAIHQLETALKLNPSLYSAYNLMGNAFLAQDRFDEAIEAYQKVIQMNPKDVSTRMLLGILYDQRKNHAKANEFYKKILDIDEDFLPAANNLAWNYAEHGKDLDGAFLLANKSLVKDPENPEYADTLGWILYKKGSYKLALVLLQKSSERFEHKNPSVLYHLGMTYHRQGDESLARDTLTKALSLDRSFAGADDAAKILQSLAVTDNAKNGLRS